MLGAVPAAAAVRTLSIVTGEIDGREVSLEVAITRDQKGRGPVKMTVDGCIPPAPESRLLDRFAGKLTSGPTGKGKLTATLRDASGTPVAVDLRLSGSDDSVAVSGSITRGETRIAIKANDLSFVDDDPVASPPDATEADSANEGTSDVVEVTIEPARVPDLVAALVSEKVEIDAAGLYPDCAALRSNKHKVNLTTDVRRTAGLTDRVKQVPGVVAVRRGIGSIGNSDAVRFKIPASAMKDGQLDQSAMAASIADRMAEAYGATRKSLDFDDVVGTYTVVLEKPLDAAPSSNLTERLGLQFNLESADGDVTVFVASTIEITVAGGQPAALRVSDVSAQDGANGITNGAALDILADKFDGRSWDDDTKTWKK